MKQSVRLQCKCPHTATPIWQVSFSGSPSSATTIGTRYLQACDLGRSSFLGRGRLGKRVKCLGSWRSSVGEPHEEAPLSSLKSSRCQHIARDSALGDSGGGVPPQVLRRVAAASGGPRPF